MGRASDRARLSTFHGNQVEAGGDVLRNTRIPAGDDVTAVWRPRYLRAADPLDLHDPNWKVTQL